MLSMTYVIMYLAILSEPRPRDARLWTHSGHFEKTRLLPLRLIGVSIGCVGGRARVAGEHQPIGYLIEKLGRRICV